MPESPHFNENVIDFKDDESDKGQGKSSEEVPQKQQVHLVVNSNVNDTLNDATT